MAAHEAWAENNDSEELWSLHQFSDRFNEAVHLCALPESQENFSHNDASDDEDNSSSKICEPYKHKYAARIMLVEMKAALSKLYDKLSEDEQEMATGQRIQERILAVSLQLGLIAVAVQEPSTGEEHFSNIVKALDEDYCLHPRRITLMLAALNQLGLLWAERMDFNQAKNHLLKSCQYYRDYKERFSASHPLALSGLFLKSDGDSNNDEKTIIHKNTEIIVDEDCCSSREQWSDFEQYHTYTLYYLAQVCTNLSEDADAARYCHATLHRQLADTLVFEPFEWSKNAATLSTFYLNGKNYSMARYLLCSASVVISSNAPISDHSSELEARYHNTRTCVDSLLGNYCVKLLQASDAQQENGDETASDNDTEASAAAQLEETKFVGLDTTSVSDMERKIPVELVKDYNGARAAFLVGLEHLERVCRFYTMEEHASLHVEAIQSISQLYKYLAAFESKPDRRSKMYKRRIDMLVPLLDELNPQYYLQVCRQLRYELAETFSGMATFKEQQCEDELDEQERRQLRSKVNSLAQTSIQHYQQFLDSYRTAEGSKPSRYPEECERAVLAAFFNMGRLWNKMSSLSRSQAVVNITNAIYSFKEMIDYVQQYPEWESKVSEELSICRELVQLLPLKLQSLSSQ